MKEWLAKISKEILKRDIIDQTIDDFIIRNRLSFPLTNELRRNKSQ